MDDIRLEQTYALSDDVVAREIEGSLIIVPLTSGIGDMEDDLYSMNETGVRIWKLLDGRRTLADVALRLSDEYQAEPGEIERDVLGLAGELRRRRMIVHVSAG